MDKLETPITGEGPPHLLRQTARETLLADQDIHGFIRKPAKFWLLTPKDSFFWRATNSVGRGIFHFLAEHDNGTPFCEIMEKSAIAVERGAPINLKDGDCGDTPLHWAVWNASSVSAAAFISCGACPFIANFTDKTPLELLRDINSIVVRRKETAERMTQLERIIISAEESRGLSSLLKTALNDGGDDESSSI